MKHPIYTFIFSKSQLGDIKLEFLTRTIYNKIPRCLYIILYNIYILHVYTLQFCKTCYIILFNRNDTICPRSSYPFYVERYYIKWVTTSWTHSMKIKVYQLFWSWKVFMSFISFTNLTLVNDIVAQIDNL